MDRAVLGIETSCDETAAAVYSLQGGLLSHRLHSQVALHARHGGVVPELASRDHVSKLLGLVEAALADAGLEGPELAGIAYTGGPGLVGALLVGGTLAVGLGLAWRVPVIAVNHLEAHLLAPMLEPDPPGYPLVALLVSGGHTMLVDVAAPGRYRVLGATLDDAAGEAFDKVAKLLGLGYPGGPALARLAASASAAPHAFPRPMLRAPGLDFSFSGLKTAVLLKVRELEASGPLDTVARAGIARSFEEAVVDTLTGKALRALDATGHQRLVVAGGVGANLRLRERLAAELAGSGRSVYYPRPEYCTDNGAMVALAGALRLAAGAPGSREVTARPRWDLEELAPVWPEDDR